MHLFLIINTIKKIYYIPKRKLQLCKSIKYDFKKGVFLTQTTNGYFNGQEQDVFYHSKCE